MKYDDASWHYGGDFPADLPQIAGATHIAMFVSWAVLNGLAGELHTEDFADDLGKLKDRAITPTTWFLSICDEKFTDEDLNEEGNRFAEAYYGRGDGLHAADGSYILDYVNAFPGIATPYHVSDTWTTFNKLEPIIRARFDAWRRVG